MSKDVVPPPRWRDSYLVIGSEVMHPDQPVAIWEYRLAPHPSSIAEARRHVRGALDDHTDSEVVDRAELVVSELVTNAVRHGPGEPVSLRLVAEPDGAVAGDVIDRGDGVIAMKPQVSDLEPGGRGLLIVDRLTTAWGVYPETTHVWFRFDN